MINVVNKSDTISFFMRKVLEKVEALEGTRLTKTQAKELQAIKSYAQSAKEDADAINEKANEMVVNALKTGRH